MHSNIYEYLCDRLSDMPRILLLCGADRRYIAQNSSDFEKFRELCKTLASFLGSDIYKSVNLAVSELFGEDVDISRSNPESLWKGFYGESDEREAITPVLIIQTAIADNLTSVVDISGATDFVMPDRYHVGLARAELLGGGELSEREKNMLIIQELRQGAQKCISATRPLVVRADCSAEITLRALEYLKTCNLLTDALILTNLDCFDTEMARVLEFDGVLIGISIEKYDESTKYSIESLAHKIPVGSIIWTLEEKDFDEFGDLWSELVRKWQRASNAPQNCALKIKEICKFY